MLASSATYDNKDVVAVAEAVEKDDISRTDLIKWYTVYKGAHLYGQEFDFDGASNYQQVFDKIRLTRNKLAPTKGASNLVKVSDELLSEFKTEQLSEDNNNKLTDKLFYISEGIRKAIDESSD